MHPGPVVTVVKAVERLLHGHPAVACGQRGVQLAHEIKQDPILAIMRRLALTTGVRYAISTGRDIKNTLYVELGSAKPTKNNQRPPYFSFI